MQYTRLGRTGLQVSRLVLGTMNFGMYTEEAPSYEIMNRALDEGINFFDTANVYGVNFFNRDAPQNPGLTEEIIGRWLAEDSTRRDQIVLATKVYIPMGRRPNERGLSAYHIRKACEDSLRRLQTDHIDLYQMHHIDRNTPWEETWQAMERLVRDGKITYVGSSNFAGWHIAQANEIAKSRHFLGLVSEQSIYNLAVRDIELEVLPACENYGLGVIPWSPLQRGVLAGVLKKQEEGRRADIGGLAKQHQEQVAQYETLCDEIGHHPAQVAIAWLLHQPAVTGPIVGPRTMEQLTSLLPSTEITLDDETLQKLDEIWPGPGGTAPEAYAW